MKKRIIFFIVMASLSYSGLFAQSPPKNGIGFLDAIPVTLSAGQSSFTDTRNTSEPAYGQYRYFSPRTGSYEITDGLKEVLKDLKSIGRNLNQLVTLAHMGRVTVINLDGVRQAFSELCAAVRLILERKRW